MSVVMLTIRDRHRSMTGKVAGNVAHAVWAALSAEPETIVELLVAMGRFIAPSHIGTVTQPLEDGVSLESADSGMLLIDLAARLAIDRNRYFQAELEGELSYHDGESSTGLHIYYELPSDWRIIDDTTHWRSLSAELRLERSAMQRFDWRAVIYEHLPEQLIEAMNHEETLLADDRVRAAHARWMLTSRLELRGRSPREVLLDQLDAIDADLESREWQWAMLGTCPPTLPTDSIAYRYGGCGQNERVLLYELVRTLLHYLDQENSRRKTTQRMVSAEELRELRDRWFEQPDNDELHGLSPREVIEQERIRRPWGITGSQAIIDHDCPLCRMLAEDSHGPAFCHLDESGFDHDFAFSRHATWQQWERDEQRRKDFERVVRDDFVAEGKSDSATDLPLLQDQDLSCIGDLSTVNRPTPVGRPDRRPEPVKGSPGSTTPAKPVRKKKPSGIRKPTGTSVPNGDSAESLTGPIWMTSMCDMKAIRECPDEALRSQLLSFGLAAHLTELRSLGRTAGIKAEIVDAPLEEFEELRGAMKEQSDWLYDSMISRCVTAIQATAQECPDLKPQVRDLVFKFEVARKLLTDPVSAPGNP